MSTSIAVTGMGIISSLGQGVANYIAALKDGRSNFVQSARFPLLDFPIIAAELCDFSFVDALKRLNYLPNDLIDTAKRAGQRAPLVIQTSIIAALEAWSHAQLFERSVLSKRLGIVVAGQNTTRAYQHVLQKKYQEESAYITPSYALHFMDTDQVGTLSEIFGIQGEGLTVGGASASGNMGIIQACRLIQLGVVDVCMVVGVLADLSAMELQAFHNIGAMGGEKFCREPEKACRPFDKEHDGFIWGQASGCLILEATHLAQQANIPLLCEIIGCGVALDGNRFSNPSARGECFAMERALANANLDVGDIDYINAHGSSSPKGDEAEIIAIRKTFGDYAKKIPLNSTKNLTGHCLWSAGVVEAIATVIQLQEGFVHANCNLYNPIDTFCRFVGRQSEKSNIQRAISNLYGFGGINTSVIFTLNGD